MIEEVKIREIIKKYASDFPKAKINIVSNDEILKLKEKVDKKKVKKQLSFFDS